MKLVTKFSLVIMSSLTILGASSFFVFYEVLDPEFQRQREESWSYRAQQSAQTMEQILNQTLVVSQILKQPLSNLADFRGPLSTLIGTSKIESIIIMDLDRVKTEISLYKSEEYTVPVAMGKKEINFLWESELFWASLRDQDYEIFVAFKLNDIIEMDDHEPVVFYYTLDEGSVLGSSQKDFVLPEELQKKIQTHSKTGIVEFLEENKKKILVTQVLPSFNFGVGVYGENALISLTWKSLIGQFLGLTFICMGLGLLIGYAFTSMITRRLERLEKNSLKIGLGQFDVQLETKDSDEVGSLSRTIQDMVTQIQQLFQDQQKQLRMESELKVAQTVQQTLFPPSILKLKDYELAGFYKSASECGGDLWGVWETPRYLNFYILDATGHGVPAALITSATRSIAAFYETLPEIQVEHIAYGLNYAINKVGNTLQQATAFVCQLDKKTGVLDYVNASHVSGYVLPANTTEKTTVKDITFLSDPIITRFGESDILEIKKGQHLLQKGESLFLVTDGLFDLKMSDGKDFQERKVLKSFIRLAAEKHDTPDLLYHFVQKAFQENGETELKDDVTLIIFKRL
jgi:serine phosphatase RsbU (regulator of sigma subunit)